MSTFTRHDLDLTMRTFAKMCADHPEWRRGQAAFNALYAVAPDMGDAVRGSCVDPFHRDERLREFWGWLEALAWHNRHST